MFLEALRSWSVSPDEINQFLEKAGTSPLKQKVKLYEVVKRPQVSLKDLVLLFPNLNEIANACGSRRDEVMESVEIFVKYEGYIVREREMADKIKRLEKIRLDDSFDYDKLKSLSTEARQKLSRIRPKSIGQASRISGVSPSDISVLLIYMGR
jgi:tRNA uridine 5-carboxymethylaminomethyl modification enzyme